jgi:hypothetical protein
MTDFLLTASKLLKHDVFTWTELKNYFEGVVYADTDNA